MITARNDQAAFTVLHQGPLRLDRIEALAALLVELEERVQGVLEGVAAGEVIPFPGAGVGVGVGVGSGVLWHGGDVYTSQAPGIPGHWDANADGPPAMSGAAYHGIAFESSVGNGRGYGDESTQGQETIVEDGFGAATGAEARAGNTVEMRVPRLRYGNWRSNST